MDSIQFATLCIIHTHIHSLQTTWKMNEQKHRRKKEEKIKIGKPETDYIIIFSFGALRIVYRIIRISVNEYTEYSMTAMTTTTALGFHDLKNDWFSTGHSKSIFYSLSVESRQSIYSCNFSSTFKKNKFNCTGLIINSKAKNWWMILSRTLCSKHTTNRFRSQKWKCKTTKWERIIFSSFKTRKPFWFRSRWFSASPVRTVVANWKNQIKRSRSMVQFRPIYSPSRGVAFRSFSRIPVAVCTEQITAIILSDSVTDNLWMEI